MRIFVLLFLTACAVTSAKGQTTSEIIAGKIATKMRDSLALSSSQQQQIYAMNIQLHRNKMAVRQKIFDRDVLRRRLQEEEDKRDSLYHSILTDDQYRLYLFKKGKLVNNN